jgi:Nucleotidyltransferase of unknown function (DUF6036)
MEKFVTDQIKKFLRAIDQNLTKRFDMIIIGGAAAALAYKVVEFTKDIDTANSLDEIESACEKAKVQTGLDIPIGPARVEESPYEYESRLVKVEVDGLKRLRIFVPEKHDLALMKITRGNANDIETVKQLNKTVGLDHKILVERFKKEMTHIIGDPKRMRMHMLAAIEAAFGDKIAAQVEKQLS